MKKNKAFTLAEVLIVIAVVGIVSTLTLPTLTHNIKNKIYERKTQVFERKFIKGLNLLNTQENGLSVRYNSTEDFVKALSKYLKIVTICSKDKLENCMSYDKIKYNTEDGTEKTVQISTIKTGKNLKLDDSYKDTAGLVLADGTSMILSYKQDCDVADPDQPFTKTIPICVAGVYDLNGSRSPNKFGTVLNENGSISAYTGDLRSINGARIGGDCVLEIGNLCVVSIATLAGDKSYDSPGMTSTTTQKYVTRSYWQGAEDYCADRDAELPSDTDMAQLYKKGSVENSTLNLIGLSLNDKIWSSTRETDPNTNQEGNSYYFELKSTDYNKTAATKKNSSISKVVYGTGKVKTTTTTVGITNAFSSNILTICVKH